ncbi:MAG: riboflavin synthase [Verrucomicrobia bacterium]|nr:riboflavin synthase [Verrucomicrobiota bacterium]MBU1734513.1 riboflavin synthase [Verrucomicrobiota bacterium]MBU1857872.1 riboflavin synthase [Verrucomicrobiota bacterium]
MFTGLIQQIGALSRHETAAGGLRLVIAGTPWNPPLTLGESMAVNGACLTLAQIQGKNFACDILQETLDRTTLGGKRPGAALNLERALRLGEALGGHLVTGHVDGIGTVNRRQAKGRDWILRVTCGTELLRGMVLKGSIAIDGVSLTIAELDRHSFSVALIPFTCEHTALGKLKAGDAVNLETDLIGKHVRRTMETGQAPIPLTWDRLRDAGFGATGFGDG